MTELRLALDAFTRSGRAVDLLGANACAMSYIEAAYELSGVARYLVASQIAVPFAGWPYGLILSRLKGGMSAEQLGREVLDAYVSQYATGGAGERVSMSLLDLSNGHAESLRSKFHELVSALEGVAEEWCKRGPGSAEPRFERPFSRPRLVMYVR